jgi:hypothetical protein
MNSTNNELTEGKMRGKNSAEIIDELVDKRLIVNISVKELLKMLRSIKKNGKSSQNE